MNGWLYQYVHVALKSVWAITAVHKEGFSSSNNELTIRVYSELVLGVHQEQPVDERLWEKIRR